MNRCLQIPDLLSVIFEVFVDPSAYPPSLATLAVLARTCKSFQRPAIRALWRDIPGLWILHCLFPTGALTLVDEDSPYIPLGRQDIWTGFAQRLARYAPHVRRINHGWSDIPSGMRKRLQASILYNLRARKDIPIPLFPNIIHISVPCLNEFPLESVFYSAVALSPSLRSVALIANDFMAHAGPLGIQPKGQSEQWDGIQHRLSPFLPFLRSFAIKGPEFEDLYTLLMRPQIDSLVLQLSTPLNRLDISSISVCPATLVALSNLPHLEQLFLTVGVQMIEEQNREPLAFPSLTDIRINIMDIERGSIFLGRLCAPSLATCVMSFKPLNQESDIPIETFLSAMSQHDRHNLTHITIDDRFACQWESGSFSFVVTYQGLRHLFSCTQLVCIDIWPATWPDSIGDDELASALSSWPNLESLHLRSGRNGQGRRAMLGEYRLTATGVCKALAQCPYLRALTLQCDFRRVSDRDDENEPHPSLASWNVLYSPITTGRAAGLWLKGRFPALRSVEYMNTLQWYAECWSSSNIWNEEGGVVCLALDQWTDVPQILREEADLDTGMDVGV